MCVSAHVCVVCVCAYGLPLKIWISIIWLGEFTRWAGYFQLKNKPYFTCICIKFGFFLSTSFRLTKTKNLDVLFLCGLNHFDWYLFLSLSKHRLTQAHTHARTQTVAYVDKCVEIRYWIFVRVVVAFCCCCCCFFSSVVLVCHFDFITGNRWQSSTIINSNIKTKSAIRASQ